MVRIAKFCQEIIKPLLPPENTSNNKKWGSFSCYKSEKSKFVKHSKLILWIWLAKWPNIFWTKFNKNCHCALSYSLSALLFMATLFIYPCQNGGKRWPYRNILLPKSRNLSFLNRPRISFLLNCRKTKNSQKNSWKKRGSSNKWSSVSK